MLISGSPIIIVLLFICLGFREGCLDQLAFDSMTPLYKLKEYTNLVSYKKNFVIEVFTNIQFTVVHRLKNTRH